MIEAPHYSAAGAKKKSLRLPAALFDGTVNEHVLHRAVVTYLANQRQGTSDTKTRSEVSGGNQKPWRQKGTGRARQGSTRSPHWRHGGIVFGPHPRDYRLGIPKKVRQLAKKSALNARAREAVRGRDGVRDPLGGRGSRGAARPRRSIGEGGGGGERGGGGRRCLTNTAFSWVRSPPRNPRRPTRHARSTPSAWTPRR